MVGAPVGIVEQNRHRQVSIPERVWGWLELPNHSPDTRHFFVSIPERVWGWLEPLLSIVTDILNQFQSLRGFGVGWSGFERITQEQQEIVSIPERVWGWLEPLPNRSQLQSSLVSIPERVWGWLERTHGHERPVFV